MKLLFKLYLLGQLVAMPFMVGALGNVMSNDKNDAVNPNIVAEANTAADTKTALCDALHGDPANAIQDDIQQLRYITSELYGDDIGSDCFATPESSRP